MVLSCPPQLSWPCEGKRGEPLGTYIYLHGGGGDDDAWTASKE
jgi:hypothetical protein